MQSYFQTLKKRRKEKRIRSKEFEYANASSICHLNDDTLGWKRMCNCHYSVVAGNHSKKKPVLIEMLVMWCAIPTKSANFHFQEFFWGWLKRAVLKFRLVYKTQYLPLLKVSKLILNLIDRPFLSIRAVIARYNDRIIFFSSTLFVHCFKFLLGKFLVNAIPSD